MKLRKISTILIAVTAAWYPPVLMKCIAQTPEDFNGLYEKYPKNTVICTSRSLDVTLSIPKDKPEIRLNESKELMVLADNATFLADSKEYFSNHYDLDKIEAFSLIPDGDKYKKIRVEKFTRTTELSDGLFFDDQYAYSFAFPSVKKGALLVTRAEFMIRDPFVTFSMDFGYAIPSQNLRITVTCPENIDIRYRLFGRDTSIVSFSKIRKGEKTIYQWEASNSKSYIQDKDAPDLQYVIPHLVVQIADYSINGKVSKVLGSVDDLYAWYYSKISGINANPSPAISQLTDSITRNMSTDREKVRTIFKWVQKNIKYVAIEDGENGYVPGEATLVLQRRYGDCKDKSSITVAMLRSQGMKASFAWVGTRDLPYKYRDFASAITDNHMIAVWWSEPDNPVLLDGTTHYHKMENIPAFIQGKECLIEKGKNDYSIYSIPVAPPAENLWYDSVSIELRNDTISGKGHVIFTGEQEATTLSVFDGLEPVKLPLVVSQQIPKASNKFIIKSVQHSDLDDIDQPFVIDYDFMLPDYLTQSRDNDYINLNLDRFPQYPNIREDRWMPVEAKTTMDRTFVCTLIVPEGYEAGMIPENSFFENPKFSFRQEYVKHDRQIILKTHIIINFQLIEGDEMEQFRIMLSELNHNLLKSIPLIKKSTL